jgi:hypothetical protein
VASREAASTAHHESVIVSSVIVYAVIDDSLSPNFPLGDAIDTFIRREDAECFIEEIRGDDPEARSFAPQIAFECCEDVFVESLAVAERQSSSADNAAVKLQPTANLVLRNHAEPL